MTVTRDVIRDLIPPYVAGDVSPDSKALVESWIAQDAELRREVDSLRIVLEPELPPLSNLTGTRTEDLFLVVLRRLSRIQLVRFLVLVLNLGVLVVIPMMYGTANDPWAFFTQRPVGPWIVFVVVFVASLAAWLALGAWQRAVIRGSHSVRRTASGT